MYSNYFIRRIVRDLRAWVQIFTYPLNPWLQITSINIILLQNCGSSMIYLKNHGCKWPTLTFPLFIQQFLIWRLIFAPNSSYKMTSNCKVQSTSSWIKLFSSISYNYLKPWVISIDHTLVTATPLKFLSRFGILTLIFLEMGQGNTKTIFSKQCHLQNGFILFFKKWDFFFY